MQIELKQIKEHKDGSATYNLEVGQDFKNAVKKQYNRKRYSDKLGARCVIDALHEMMIKDEKIGMLEADNALKKAYKLNGINA